MAKTIRVLIPTFNEEENVVQIADAVIDHFKQHLPEYNYIIHFIDNKSTDNTRNLIREMCKQNKKIKATFNAKNFGQFNSPYYGLLQYKQVGYSDCTVLMCADFQDPVEVISEFVKKWEEGHQVVVGVKSKSKENKLMRFFRSIYYKFIKHMSPIKQIEQFTGFALYDNSFIDALSKVDDPTPFIRGLVAELCGDIALVEYTQAKRKAGKTHNNFKTLYDAAMLSVTTYTKKIPRLATIFGAIFSGISFVSLCVVTVLSIVFKWGALWPILNGLAFIIFVNMFFIGMLGEYIVNMNVRLLKRPLVIEQERLNFEGKDD